MLCMDSATCCMLCRGRQRHFPMGWAVIRLLPLAHCVSCAVLYLFAFRAKGASPIGLAVQTIGRREGLLAGDRTRPQIYRARGLKCCSNYSVLCFYTSSVRVRPLLLYNMLGQCHSPSIIHGTSHNLVAFASRAVPICALCFTDCGKPPGGHAVRAIPVVPPR